MAHLKADDGHQIRQLMDGGFSAHLVRPLDGITIPQAINDHALSLQFLIERFQLCNHYGVILVGLAVDDSQCNDFILASLQDQY